MWNKNVFEEIEGKKTKQFFKWAAIQPFVLHTLLPSHNGSSSFFIWNTSGAVEWPANWHVMREMQMPLKKVSFLFLSPALTPNGFLDFVELSKNRSKVAGKKVCVERKTYKEFHDFPFPRRILGLEKHFFIFSFLYFGEIIFAGLLS